MGGDCIKIERLCTFDEYMRNTVDKGHRNKYKPNRVPEAKTFTPDDFELVDKLKEKSSYSGVQDLNSIHRDLLSQVVDKQGKRTGSTWGEVLEKYSTVMTGSVATIREANGGELPPELKIDLDKAKFMAESIVGARRADNYWSLLEEVQKEFGNSGIKIESKDGKTGNEPFRRISVYASIFSEETSKNAAPGEQLRFQAFFRDLTNMKDSHDTNRNTVVRKAIIISKASEMSKNIGAC